MTYLVDSGVYIRGFREIAYGDALRAFHAAQLSRIVLSAVVLHELLVGATTRRRELALQRGLVEPFRVRRRLHVPTRQTWELAAQVDRRLRARPHFAAKLKTRSFLNDVLIAASAREIGAVIVSENSDDFGIISSVLDIRYVEPWPQETAPGLALGRRAHRTSF
jgi:predicted nucleic acid-binding protein